MRMSLTKYAIAGCAAFMTAGCASQQNIAQQYLPAAPSVQAVYGASMLQRGRAQLDAGLDALAIGSFRAELRFNPEQVDAYNGLAVAYGRIGRSDLAQRFFEIALAKDPLNAKVQANLARLSGNKQYNVRQAAARPAVTPLEPVAATAEANNQAEYELATGFDLPSLAWAQMQPEAQTEASSGEILERRGVLSSRFALATAIMAMHSNGRNAALTTTPSITAKLPAPERPQPYLQSNLRAGSRLERLSLNEVRLIARSANSPMHPPSAPAFDGFGDRLALWLPAYISTEQAESRLRGDEEVLVMALPERASVPNMACSDGNDTACA
jgi:hypothetical protein